MMKFLHWIKFNNVKKERSPSATYYENQIQGQGHEQKLRMGRIKQQISKDSSGKRDSLFSRMDNVVGELKQYIGTR